MQEAAGGGVAGTTGDPTDLEVKEGTVVTVDTSLFSSTFKEFFKGDSLGTFSLEAPANGTIAALDPDDDNDSFTIDAKTGKITSKFQMDFEDTGLAKDDNGDGTINDATTVGEKIGESVAGTKFFNLQVTYTKRDATTHVETIILELKDNDSGDGAAIGSQLDDIEVETSAKATRAIETLDKALEEVSSAQAKLGAIQNRLQHNIDNLSKGAMLTEQSVGRVVDADFATETSNLSKQQILNQAATAVSYTHLTLPTILLV